MPETLDKPYAGLRGLLGRIAIRDKFALAYAVVLVLFTVTCVMFTIGLAEVRAARDWQEHSQQVLLRLEDVLTSVIDQETGLRGFLLSPDDEFLQPYDRGRAAFEANIAEVRRLTQDTPELQARVDRLVEKMRVWQLSYAPPLIEAARAGKVDVIRDTPTRKAGKALIDGIRAEQGGLRATELTLLAERTADLDERMASIRLTTLLLLLGGVVFGVFTVIGTSRHIAQPVTRLSELTKALANGSTDIAIPYLTRGDEVGSIARSLEVFKKSTLALTGREWVKNRLARLSSAVQGTMSERDFAHTLGAELAESVNAAYAVIYIWQEDSNRLEYAGGYGVPGGQAVTANFRLGESFCGQCAADRRPISVTQVPTSHFYVRTATAAAPAPELLFLPLSGLSGILGVIELGLFHPPTVAQKEFLDEANRFSQLALDTLRRGIKTQTLLAETQSQKQRLQESQESLRVQQEELRHTNESLREKTLTLQEQQQRLKASEEELRTHAEELRNANSSLEEKTEELRAQKAALEDAQRALEDRAVELERASRYKSEFLANMSHELRTPLNSLLILSKSLADNGAGHLDGEEVESARIIYESGSNLLSLINDILDLSKIEAGKMEVSIEDMSLQGFAAGIERHFRHVAETRALKFEVLLTPDLPPLVRADEQKLRQIINNLLSNAFKFTHEGGVRLHISKAGADAVFEGGGLKAERTLALRVSDSGIGIAADKLGKVFGAFEQADSGTSRRYGGTGLGLSICKGLARLMGGDIQLKSTEGKGSVFTLYVPLTPAEAQSLPATVPPPTAATSLALPLPRRATTAASEGSILIVEDDSAFAHVLADIVRKGGHEVTLARDGEEGLRLAQTIKPSGLLLDIGLPKLDGWQVMEALKREAATKQIPIHVIAGEDHAKRAAAMGAAGFLMKPVTREGVQNALARLLIGPGARRLLVVDDDAGARRAVRTQLAELGAEADEAEAALPALEKIKATRYDCIILDLGLPDISGFEFLERASAQGELPPVVIYSGRELTREESLKLHEYTDSIVMKGSRAPERLLDEVTLFLHAVKKPKAPPVAREPVQELKGKTILVVDDDMRNIFALSKSLRARGMKAIMAQDGQKALKQLEANPEVHMVLMDIMMPGMDGYDTMRAIRANPVWQKLPIIAVTAKAMKGDREKCIEAGANDYCSKPIDVEKLLEQMRKLA